MSRQAQLILICEDRQHETFARRFLERAGWAVRRLRVLMAPPGRGSAEQFVRDTFPIELSAYRTKRHRVAQRLVVVCDGDQRGVDSRINDLAAACRAQGIESRQDIDHVAIFIPTWNIETWLAYLNGADVDETKSDYPRLDRPRDCQKHVDRLYQMCQRQTLRQPAPPSLDAACVEYRTRL